MTCSVFLVQRGAWSVVELWTATRPECVDWLVLYKWACDCGGWMEWFRP